MVYFLIYAWGFTLLFKSDTEYRLDRLEKAVTALQRDLAQDTTGPLDENHEQQGESKDAEDGLKAGHGVTAEVADTANTEPTETVKTSERETSTEPEPTAETTGEE